MSQGHNVQLDLNAQIVFPAECVVCDRNANGGVKAVKIGPFDRDRSNARIKDSLSVPMHPSCSRKYTFLFWKKYSLTFVVLAISIIIVIMYFDISKEPIGQYLFKRLLLLLASTAIMIPIILFWNLKRPLPIECEHEKGKVDITFKSKTYAERFAQINQAALKKIN